MGDEFYKTVFSASQSPFGKTGTVPFEKEFKYFMQYYVVSCEGSAEIFPAPPQHRSFCLLQYLILIALSIHIVLLLDFTTDFACLLIKVFIDIHCFIKHNKKYGIHNADVWVFNFFILLCYVLWAQLNESCQRNSRKQSTGRIIARYRILCLHQLFFYSRVNLFPISIYLI